MSLNDEQREGTRRELLRNLELCGLATDALASELGFSPARLKVTLNVEPDSDPVDVWMLRDVLENAVRAAGGTPERHSVLTETARADAQRWFGLPVRPELRRRGGSRD
jgi:hypothetical protein